MPILSQKNNISICSNTNNFLNHKWKNKFDCQTQCVLKILSGWLAFSAIVPISSTRALTYRHMKYFWQFSECCLLNNYFIKAYTRDLHQSNQVEVPCVAWYYLPKELGKASVLTKLAGLHVCTYNTWQYKRNLKTPIIRQDWLYTDGCCLLISPIPGMDCCSVSMPDVIDMHP